MHVQYIQILFFFFKLSQRNMLVCFVKDFVLLLLIIKKHIIISIKGYVNYLSHAASYCIYITMIDISESSYKLSLKLIISDIFIKILLWIYFRAVINSNEGFISADIQEKIFFENFC